MSMCGLKLTILNKTRELVSLREDYEKGIYPLICRNSKNVDKLKRLLKENINKCEKELDELLDLLEE